MWRASSGKKSATATATSSVVDAERPGGRHETAFDGARLPAGVYVVRLTAGGHARTRRLTVAR